MNGPVPLNSRKAHRIVDALDGVALLGQTPALEDTVVIVDGLNPKNSVIDAHYWDGVRQIFDEGLGHRARRPYGA